MILWQKISIHCLVWACMMVLAAPDMLQLYRAGDVPKLMEYGVTLCCMMGLFYVCYLVIWPRFNVQGSRWQAIVLLLFSPLVFWLVWHVTYGLFLWMAGDPLPERGLEETINLTSGAPFRMIIISGILCAIQEAGKRYRENKALRHENEQVELDYLRTQFNPHFLFNMLGSVYYSAAKVSDKLADHVKRVADLMEYAIRVNKEGLVDLDTEVAHIRNYTELFRIRFAPNFNAEVKVQGNTAGIRIPPLLLIPFVENAFKHGVVTDPDFPILFVITASENSVYFSTHNKVGNHSFKDSTKGIGLASIRRRLQIMYPGRHALKIAETQGIYSAQLFINL